MNATASHAPLIHPLERCASPDLAEHVRDSGMVLTTGIGQTGLLSQSELASQQETEVHLVDAEVAIRMDCDGWLHLQFAALRSENGVCASGTINNEASGSWLEHVYVVHQSARHINIQTLRSVHNFVVLGAGHLSLAHLDDCLKRKCLNFHGRDSHACLRHSFASPVLALKDDRRDSDKERDDRCRCGCDCAPINHTRRAERIALCESRHPCHCSFPLRNGSDSAMTESQPHSAGPSYWHA